MIANLVAMGHLTGRQGDVLTSARDFMLRIRTLVQLAGKRRFDQLTFEIQEAIAPSLYPDAKAHEGDIRSAVAPAVEALMRDYYLHARAVVQVADRLLEAARVPARRKPRIAQVDENFITFNGELALKDPRLFVERPAEMVRMFRVAVADGLPVYGHTKELVAETIARDPAPLAADPIANRLFLEALVDPRDATQPAAFEIMHQLGILSALMPEWTPCTGRVQHDLYHVYTVDQHQLYALAMQKRLARGELAEEHPLATELWKEVKRPAALFLATLLHDVGKPLGKGHAEKGAIVAGAIARRLGLSDDEIEVSEFLVRQHLTMSHLSQRRDLSDPEVIARFAERVGSDDRLVKLYLLTLCDTAMTAPDNLTAWKAGLLRDLMIRTRAYFRGEQSGDAASDEQSREVRAKIVEQVELPEARALVDGIDPRLVVQLTARQSARHIKLVHQMQGKHPPVGLQVRCFPMRGHSELMIVAPDEPGVLATIAGALTANRVDVLGAVLGHVDTPTRRLVIDTFYVRDLKGEAIADDDPRWARLLTDLRELLAGAPDSAAVASLIARRRPKSGMPKRVTPGVPTEIKLHDDSTAATIVEVFTLDRVGVLYAITQTLAELGLDISLAKVSTEGEKVADVFYVTRAGKHITDEAERETLIQRLHLAVEAPGLDGQLMSVVDIPPGIGLVGTPLGMFEAPKRARRLSAVSFASVIVMAVITWYFVSKHWWRWHASTQFVLPLSFIALSGIGFAVRRAKIAITRDGVRWGWTALNFTQEAARIVTCHAYTDGVALEAKRGSWWFLGARDWDRFDVLVRQLKRAELPVVEHEGRAPLRARLQSYGRFLDALLVGSMLAGFVIMLWAA